jgi:4-amino-4-deoxy-L-arabinose transferase-like glycosyltransferase
MPGIAIAVVKGKGRIICKRLMVQKRERHIDATRILLFWTFDILLFHSCNKINYKINPYFFMPYVNLACLSYLLTAELLFYKAKKLKKSIMKLHFNISFRSKKTKK